MLSTPHDSVDHAHSMSGDAADINAWLLLASSTGRFRPAVAADDWLDLGSLVGHVVASGHESPVHATRAGTLMGLLADDGELVRDSQPVAWLELAS